MLSGKRVKSLNELVSIAARTPRLVIPPGCNHSFPVPKKTPSSLRMISFLYRAPFDFYLPNQAKAKVAIYPPHKILVQDAHTGRVVRFADCRPQDFGIDHPTETPLQEFLLDLMPGVEDPFLPQKQLFMKISPRVWQIFSRARKSRAPSKAAVVREYKLLFDEVMPKPLIPFYRAVSPDFFDWLERIRP